MCAALIVTGFILGSLYTLQANLREYHRLSAKPPYQPVYSALLANFYNDRRYPELNVSVSDLNPEYQKINVEVFQIALDRRPLYEELTRRQFMSKFSKEWPLFLRHFMQNIVWLWDKDHLSAYTDVFYPYDIIPVRIYNLILLLLALAGIVRFAVSGPVRALRNPFFLFTVTGIAFVTFTFALVSNETRHTIAMYPLIIVWSGSGLMTVLDLPFLHRRTTPVSLEQGKKDDTI
jgi:hypothetical protein